MKISGSIASLKDGKAVVFEMTDELREKWMKITSKIVDVLMTETSGPIEARMVLEHVINGLSDTYGIKGVIIEQHGDSEA